MALTLRSSLLRSPYASLFALTSSSTYPASCDKALFRVLSSVWHYFSGKFGSSSLSHVPLHASQVHCLCAPPLSLSTRPGNFFICRTKKKISKPPVRRSLLLPFPSPSTLLYLQRSKRQNVQLQRPAYPCSHYALLNPVFPLAFAFE